MQKAITHRKSIRFIESQIARRAQQEEQGHESFRRQYFMREINTPQAEREIRAWSRSGADPDAAFLYPPYPGFRRYGRTH